MKRNPHVGSDFDDFLQEEGILDEVQAVAVKRVLAHQLEQGMKAKQLNKTAMAKRMGTTRAQLDRLLDPANPSATLATLVKAANAVGKRVKISLVKRLINRALRSPATAGQEWKSVSAVRIAQKRTHRLIAWTRT